MKKKTGNPDWSKGMRSPNPNGRPKGIIDKRQNITQALLNDAQDIVSVVITKAKAGDLKAASLVLSRVLPTLASQSELVTFNLNPSAPLATQAEQVLIATAEGEISPNNAKEIIETIGTLVSIRQIDELDSRLNVLESLRKP